MTRISNEEAINLLVNATYSDEWQGNEELTTAHNMAIEALKQKSIFDKSRRMASYSRKEATRFEMAIFETIKKAKIKTREELIDFTEELHNLLDTLETIEKPKIKTGDTEELHNRIERAAYEYRFLKH